MKRKLLTLVGILIVVGVVAGTYNNRQLIRDTYIVKRTDTQPAALAVAGNLELTSQAEFTYEASQPEVQTSQAFNQSCGSVTREHSIVLGCYTRQRIFIYDVNDSRLAGVKEVTAAHELLHAIYERMDPKEKEEVNTLLRNTAASIQDQRFKDTMAEYKRTEPDQVDNELHSIIGTEVAVIPSALETHYAQYFKDRAKIVAYSKQYEGTFTKLGDQIKDYDAQLASLATEKKILETTLAGLQTSLDANRSQLQSLRGSGNTAEYNAGVPGYNQQIATYNQSVNELKEIVSSYNDIVQKRNALATTQNELVKQLDSNYSLAQ